MMGWCCAGNDDEERLHRCCPVIIVMRPKELVFCIRQRVCASVREYIVLWTHQHLKVPFCFPSAHNIPILVLMHCVSMGSDIASFRGRMLDLVWAIYCVSIMTRVPSLRIRAHSCPFLFCSMGSRTAKHYKVRLQ